MPDKMQSDAEVLSHAMRMSGRNDHYFKELFGVAQSTVSRLRAKKIQKVKKYLDKLDATDEFRSDAVTQIDVTVNALAATAKSDRDLAEVLHALQNFVHKSMR